MIKFGEVKINELSKHLIQNCLDSNRVTMGPYVAEFEKKWGRLFNYQYNVAMNNGTSACMAACMALYDLGAKPGDEIIVPALSFIATANAVRAAGFRPVFVDVHKEDMLINERLITQKITKRTIALMPVTLMGKPPDMRHLKGLAEHHNLKLIVDNCEGHGCQYEGKFMGAWADMVCYSFYAAHVLFSGEMGMVSTNNEELGKVLRSIRSHGRPVDSLYFDHQRYGLNLKPTDLHASIGLGTIDDFWDIFDKRKENLNEIRNIKGLRDKFWLSEEQTNGINSPHGCSFIPKNLSNADAGLVLSKFTQHLDHLIEWKRNFGCMTHHGAFKYLKHSPNEFPNATYAGNYGVHIGCHYYLTWEELDQMKKLLGRFHV